MITDRASLHYYIEQDRFANGVVKGKTIKDFILSFLLRNKKFEYLRCLRHLEYWYNSKPCLFQKIMYFFYDRKLQKLSEKTGIELYVNVAGPGLSLPHGKVTISDYCHIGANVKILSYVTIGGRSLQDPHSKASIGDNVYIGTGACILGSIRIANNVVIGAHSVVINDIEQEGATVVGCPAKIVAK